MIFTRQTVSFFAFLFILIFFAFGCVKSPVKVAELFSSEIKTSPAVENIAVTIDLCPSSHPYAKELFNALGSISKRVGKPVPIAVCVSGRWLERHQSELAAIRRLNLNITWVNHSYSHPVDHDFLNNPDVNFNYEVLHNVKVMERYGLKPSKYFRFPGLRHNQQRLAELKQMGYISLDADAWLGKGQPIKNGSIVLIHGNGNESPKVVKNFIIFLKKNGQKIVLVPISSLAR